MDRGEVVVHKSAKKKKLGQRPAILTEQAWSLTDCLYSKKFQYNKNQELLAFVYFESRERNRTVFVARS